jgi:predicted esterase
VTASPGGRDPAPPSTRHLVVPRTARYHVLGDARSAREWWVVLHGYGQLAERFLAPFAPFAEGRLIIAPEALSRFYLTDERGRHGPDSLVGATWMTREDRVAEIADYVRYLDAVCDDALAAVDRARMPLHVLGFSQGAATACRWLQLGAPAAERLVLWGGAVPPDVAVEDAGSAIRRARLTLVVGDADQYVTAGQVAEQEARLRGHAVPYELVTFAGGHRIEEDTLRRVMG